MKGESEEEIKMHKKDPVSTLKIDINKEEEISGITKVELQKNTKCQCDQKGLKVDERPFIWYKSVGGKVAK